MATETHYTVHVVIKRVDHITHTPDRYASSNQVAKAAHERVITDEAEFTLRGCTIAQVVLKSRRALDVIHRPDQVVQVVQTGGC